jgi:hypothetical protein
MEFAELKEGTIKLTAAGRVFAQSDIGERKPLFREHLLRFVPLAAHIRHVLDERRDHRAPRARFEFELEDHLNRNDAEKTLHAPIAWGRYAELFTTMTRYECSAVITLSHDRPITRTRLICTALFVLFAGCSAAAASAQHSLRMSATPARATGSP